MALIREARLVRDFFQRQTLPPNQLTCAVNPFPYQPLMRCTAEFRTKLTRKMEYAKSYRGSHIGERDTISEILGHIPRQEAAFGRRKGSRTPRLAKFGVRKAAQDMHASLRKQGFHHDASTNLAAAQFLPKSAADPRKEVVDRADPIADLDIRDVTVVDVAGNLRDRVMGQIDMRDRDRP